LALLVAACAGVDKAPPPKPAAALKPPPPFCGDFSFPIYFETGSDRLTDAARLEVVYAAERVRGCHIDQVEVVGLSDAAGRAVRNLALSKARAAAVAAAFADQGFPSPRFRVEALGGAGALSPDGDPEVLRRRADVVVRASPQPAKAQSAKPM
jgi:outer membrane protein OmpA-like peptidoglycan-associated protein